MHQQVQQAFVDRFGYAGELFFAPGRVNLIGEHIDYNGGYVFPCALSLGTVGVAAKRNDRIMRFASLKFPETAEIPLDAFAYNPDYGWINYLLGVVWQFAEYPLGGFDILLDGDLPNGAGLSSSASVELLMGVVLNELFGCGMDRVEMVRRAQKAENAFVGVNCGIMDQFAVGMGRKDHAILLDCNEVKHEYVPLDLGDCRIVLANTNKRRGLAGSKYNERRAECEAALAILAPLTGINALCDMKPDEFARYQSHITDTVIRKRAQHAIEENHRVLEAVRHLRAGNLEEFGLLMNQSHVSLRDLYEVTGAELDVLAEEAWKIPGVLGARMTGAGFGGCTVAIVRKDAIPDYEAALSKIYLEKTGLAADFYVAEVGDGAGKRE